MLAVSIRRTAVHDRDTVRDLTVAAWTVVLENTCQAAACQLSEATGHIPEPAPGFARRLAAGQADILQLPIRKLGQLTALPGNRHIAPRTAASGCFEE